MKLGEFIQETLVEIAYGVAQAKVKAKDLVAISPGHMDGQKINEKSYVDFDIAVTVNERQTKDRKGKAAVKAEIAVFGSRIGGELNAGGENSAVTGKEIVNRVKFQVPVYLNAHHRGDASFDKE